MQTWSRTITRTACVGHRQIPGVVHADRWMKRHTKHLYIYKRVKLNQYILILLITYINNFLSSVPHMIYQCMYNRMYSLSLKLNFNVISITHNARVFLPMLLISMHLFWACTSVHQGISSRRG